MELGIHAWLYCVIILGLVVILWIIKQEKFRQHLTATDSLGRTVRRGPAWVSLGLPFDWHAPDDEDLDLDDEGIVPEPTTDTDIGAKSVLRPGPGGDVDVDVTVPADRYARSHGPMSGGPIAGTTGRGRKDRGSPSFQVARGVRRRSDDDDHRYAAGGGAGKAYSEG